jgi:hypothetical protein
LNNKDFINALLSLDQPMGKEPVRFSMISSLLRAARELSGRDMVTGIYMMNELNEDNFQNQTYFPFKYSGLINYLIFLEQIGSAFELKQSSSTSSNKGLIYALSVFSSLGTEESKCILSLRNSLAHRFGLATESKPKHNIPMKFSINLVDQDERIVLIPESKWDGKFEDKSDSSLTTVYLISLLNLIESIYKNVIEENAMENINLKISREEVFARYTFII